jgi:hypothetical protein
MSEVPLCSEVMKGVVLWQACDLLGKLRPLFLQFRVYRGTSLIRNSHHPRITIGP